MGLFDLFRKQEPQEKKSQEPENSAGVETQKANADYKQLAEQIVKILKEKTTRKTVEMKFCNQVTELTSSKLGGVPFIPAGGEYPINEGTGEKLYLLIQINFSEMPHIPNYPTEGILQIFIGADDLYGCDLDAENSQENWRIIYHEDISNGMSKEEVLALMPDRSLSLNLNLPMENSPVEYLIRFEEGEMAIDAGNFDIDKCNARYCGHLLPDELKGVDWVDYPDEMLPVFEEMMGSGCRLGGYPSFTQSDPREYNIPENFELLLQIDSVEDEEGNQATMWGDMGIANFFIDPEALKNKDFSNVYYNWDCG